MTFKKVKHGKGLILKAKIKDSDGSLLENWIIMLSDLKKWTSLMSKKYGLKEKSKDLDWAFR